LNKYAVRYGVWEVSALISDVPAPVATREPRRRRRSIYCVFISPR